MDKIEIFINRLKKIGINIELSSNLPWIYLTKINNKKVKETFLGEHGFTIMFYPIRKEQGFKFTDITEIFKLIRKYL